MESLSLGDISQLLADDPDALLNLLPTSEAVFAPSGPLSPASSSTPLPGALATHSSDDSTAAPVDLLTTLDFPAQTWAVDCDDCGPEQEDSSCSAPCDVCQPCSCDEHQMQQVPATESPTTPSGSSPPGASFAGDSYAGGLSEELLNELCAACGLPEARPSEECPEHMQQISQHERTQHPQGELLPEHCSLSIRSTDSGTKMVGTEIWYRVGRDRTPLRALLTIPDEWASCVVAVEAAVLHGESREPVPNALIDTVSAKTHEPIGKHDLRAIVSTLPKKTSCLASRVCENQWRFHPLVIVTCKKMRCAHFFMQATVHLRCQHNTRHSLVVYSEPFVAVSGNIGPKKHLALPRNTHPAPNGRYLSGPAADYLNAGGSKTQLSSAAGPGVAPRDHANKPLAGSAAASPLSTVSASPTFAALAGKRCRSDASELDSPSLETEMASLLTCVAALHSRAQDAAVTPERRTLLQNQVASVQAAVSTFLATVHDTVTDAAQLHASKKQRRGACDVDAAAERLLALLPDLAALPAADDACGIADIATSVGDAVRAIDTMLHSKLYEQATSALSPPPSVRPAVYSFSAALVIGINDYSLSSRLLPLSGAVDDAKAVGLLLKHGHAFDHVEVLCNCTLDQIRDALARLNDAVPQTSDPAAQHACTLVYFAGHSVRGHDDRGYLVPVDGTPRALYSMLSMEELCNTVRSSRSCHSLVVLDTCFSGLVSRALAPPPQPMQHSAVDVLASCVTAGAYEINGRGIFTHRLIAGLEGEAFADAPLINANDLVQWMLSGAETTLAEQRPFLCSVAGARPGSFMFREPPPRFSLHKLMLHAMATHSCTASTDHNAVRYVPAEDTPYFTGRAALMSRLRSLLHQHHRVVLTGLGGIGKTQLAVHYAKVAADQYRFVLFALADSEVSLRASYVAMAPLLLAPALLERQQGDDEVAQLVVDWLSRHSGWLLILDNADDPHARFLDQRPGCSLVPQCEAVRPGGRLLITSRHREWSRLRVAPEAVLAVDPLPTAEALRFLYRRAGIPLPRSADAANDEAALRSLLHLDPELNAAHSVVAALQGLPLAVEQAGAYLASIKDILPSAPFAYLHQHYQSERVLARESPAFYRRDSDSCEGDFLTVYTTWKLSVRRLPRDAVDLLTLASYCDPHAIPLQQMIAAAAADASPCVSYGKTGDVSDAAPCCILAAPVVSSIRALLDCSLLSTRSPGVFDVHRLVQESTRADVSDPAACIHRAAELLAPLLRKFDPYGASSGYTVAMGVVPHVLALTQHARDLNTDAPLILPRLLTIVARVLMHHADFPAARDALQQGISLLPSLPSAADAVELVALASTLAHCYLSMGSFLEPALEQAELAVDTASRFLDDTGNTPERAFALLTLARVHVQLHGSLERAVPWFDAAAAAYAACGDVEEARVHIELAHVLLTKPNVDLPVARAQLDHALALTASVWPKQQHQQDGRDLHPLLASLFVQLASYWYQRDHLKAAMRLARLVLLSYVHLRDPTSRCEGCSTTHLALLTSEQAHAHDNRAAGVMPRMPDEARLLVIIGRVLARSKSGGDAADRILHAALRIRRRVYGDQHVETIASLIALAETAASPAAALGWYRDAADLYPELVPLPESHPAVLWLRAELAACELASGGSASPRH